MAKRPGAVALAVGTALCAVLSPGAAAAQDGEALPRAVSGGYASWNTAVPGLTGRGIALAPDRPAVQGAADRSWFPATGGGADPETGAADVELSGTARLERSADPGDPGDPLVLSGLRLELTGGGDGGVLHVRAVRDGRAREVTLAEIASGGAEPAVRAGGMTWTGLRASLTDEGAGLMSDWSGERFASGDALGVLDVTAGTGVGGSTSGDVPSPSPSANPAVPDAPTPESQREQVSAPMASVAHSFLTAGEEQRVIGEGFAPGAVVLVAIDGDTRYQAVADDEGRVDRDFPVYATAVEGEHTVELSAVTGQQGAAVAQFTVRTAN
ncbi:HtaA domain-containing protein [Streptomyces sp. NPDC056948]|uniref:HtaA domain-containing protein n=1 Tax=Streptomyces sp. NPDC056948 TaxID=3345975 RepID=UPI003624E123